jgi:hypothetical protein
LSIAEAVSRRWGLCFSILVRPDSGIDCFLSRCASLPGIPRSESPDRFSGESRFFPVRGLSFLGGTIGTTELGAGTEESVWADDMAVGC